MAKADWTKIKNEYINTNTSYRKLADKYNVSKNQIANRASTENWKTLRQKQQDKIGTELGQKTAEKIIQTEVDRIGDLLKLSDEAQKQIELGLSQLNKYMDLFGNIHESEIIDINKLRKLIAAMKDLKDIIRTDAGNDMRKLDEVLEKIEGNI